MNISRLPKDAVESREPAEVVHNRMWYVKDPCTTAVQKVWFADLVDAYLQLGIWRIATQLWRRLSMAGTRWRWTRSGCIAWERALSISIYGIAYKDLKPSLMETRLLTSCCVTLQTFGTPARSASNGTHEGLCMQFECYHTMLACITGVLSSIRNETTLTSAERPMTNELLWGILVRI